MFPYLDTLGGDGEARAPVKVQTGLNLAIFVLGPVGGVLAPLQCALDLKRDVKEVFGIHAAHDVVGLVLDEECVAHLQTLQARVQLASVRALGVAIRFTRHSYVGLVVFMYTK